MFDRFTNNARRAMGLSRQVAQELRHDHIGVEHILIGIAKSGGTANSMRGMGRLGARVKSSLLPGDLKGLPGQLPVNSQGKRALEDALEAASNWGDRFIGTLHLLRGVCVSQDESMRAAFEADGITESDIEVAAAKKYRAGVVQPDLLAKLSQKQRALFARIVEILKRREPDLVGIVKNRGLVDLSPVLKRAVVDVLACELVAIGLEQDGEPNEEGRCIEELIDFAGSGAWD